MHLSFCSRCSLTCRRLSTMHAKHGGLLTFFSSSNIHANCILLLVMEWQSWILNLLLLSKYLSKPRFKPPSQIVPADLCCMMISGQRDRLTSVSGHATEGVYYSNFKPKLGPQNTYVNAFMEGQLVRGNYHHQPNILLTLRRKSAHWISLQLDSASSYPPCRAHPGC